MPGIDTCFSILDLSHFLSHTMQNFPSHISPLVLAHGQCSNSSIMFLQATSISDTYGSIQRFLHHWRKGSDCTDRPWHPPNKSHWVKGWQLSTHETCFRPTESLLGFCVCARPCQQPNRQTHSACHVQEDADWQSYTWRTKAKFQHGFWKILHSLFLEEPLRHLQDAPKALVH